MKASKRILHNISTGTENAGISIAGKGIPLSCKQPLNQNFDTHSKVIGGCILDAIVYRNVSETYVRESTILYPDYRDIITPDRSYELDEDKVIVDILRYQISIMCQQTLANLKQFVAQHRPEQPRGNPHTPT